MIIDKDTKVNRVLTIYSKLVRGDVVKKKEMSELFKVNKKTIQRDLEDIRAYFSENRERFGTMEVVYRHDRKGYSLNNREDVLSKESILAITKILLESRAFCKEEINSLANSILRQAGTKQRKYVQEIIGNELLNYVPLEHNELLLSKIWDLSELIRNKEVTQIIYNKISGVEVKRIVKPVAIIFSEYYFYLIAYFKDFDSPTVFRIDRIKEYKELGEKFFIPSVGRFEDGEFRKRVQFMYAGKLMKIKFEYTGASIDAVLDRLPTARIIESVEGKFTIEAEVYGKGIKMWLLSQGKNIRVISPVELYEEILNEIDQIKRLYEINYGL
ncbi:helix-turn-helix transcriptional regulator [Clostridium grantii]|uniref:Predicted DNA-binding transcriptional regulator YafY, contains an HTH and WYL domains n=1 Tax=Clostridium grantii DSM 8605 TaxID=1121316 RepID=A0A1M5SN00_9CLOT|nr:WYL domain-containing protein [Clostridium grantii]SHH39897.1 Predicted DNA-binding transcriptional regulator YafY, contains an HTH and WYL domains [Clostridium grantii DSM 8605]